MVEALFVCGSYCAAGCWSSFSLVPLPLVGLMEWLSGCYFYVYLLGVFLYWILVSSSSLLCICLLLFCNCIDVCLRRQGRYLVDLWALCWDVGKLRFGFFILLLLLIVFSLVCFACHYSLWLILIWPVMLATWSSARVQQWVWFW